MEHGEAPAGKRRKIKRNKKSKAARKAKGKEVDNEEEEEEEVRDRDLPLTALLSVCGGVCVRWCAVVCAVWRC